MAMNVPHEKRFNQRQYLRKAIEDSGQRGVTGPELIDLFTAEFGKPLMGHSARLSELRDRLYPEGMGLYAVVEDEDGQVWRYTIAPMTPLYRKEYLDEPKCKFMPVSWTAWEIFQEAHQSGADPQTLHWLLTQPRDAYRDIAAKIGLKLFDGLTLEVALRETLTELAEITAPV